MAGRGRGRGRAALSFSTEALGFAPGEALPGPSLQPPPDYPLLEFPPAPLYSDPKAVAQVSRASNFLESLGRFRKALVHEADKAFVRKGDPGSEPSVQLTFDWARLPPELRPLARKHKPQQAPAQGSAPPAKQAKDKDIQQLLSKLEEVENKKMKVEPEEEEEGKENKKGEDNDEFEEEQEEDSDEEMDEGTDYNRNYFDNGEDYLDEDDDDDGPIY